MKQKSLSLRVCAVLAAWFFASVVAAQQVVVEKDSALHAEPRPDAPVVTQLKQGTTGEAIGKQGAWVNIRTPSASGWVYSFNLRFGAAQASSSSGSGDAGLASRLFGGRQKPAVTATIGIRGLEAEDLKQARFDEQQMNLLDRYAASKADGESAARASGLAAVRVEYLDK